MRLKVFRLFLLAILIGGAFNNLPSKALEPNDCTSEKYLLDHGHSEEIIRMINIEKSRTGAPVDAPSKSENKFKKFFKNLWFEQDLTLPTTDFGYNTVKTVETDSKLLPEDLTQPVHNFVKKCKKDKKDTSPDENKTEININDVKVRETN